MKIELSREELNNIMSLHFNKTVTHVTIKKPVNGNPLYNSIVGKMINYLKTQTPILVMDAASLETMIREPAYKLSMLKALRDSVPGLGLADAKYSVEDWDTVKEFIIKHNRFPNVNLNGGQKVTFE